MDVPVSYELWMGGRLGITVYTFIQLDGLKTKTSRMRKPEPRILLSHLDQGQVKLYLSEYSNFQRQNQGNSSFPLV